MSARDILRAAHMSGQVKLREKTKVESSPKIAKKEEKDIPTAIKQVKRNDVSIDEYGIKPDISNYQLYNYQLSEFLSSFSKMNKKNGGNPITKSQLIETILGFAYYDLKLEPKGFQNTQELLEFLQKKIKN